jgi:N-acetylglucosaminyldiphosphoundecaprenol N-acetyl-beta-D-mannosaminyltransferase
VAPDSARVGPPGADLPTVNVLGVQIHNCTRAELLERLTQGALFTPNVDIIMKLRADPEFHALFHRAEFRVCDSRIVQAGARFLGTPIKEKIAGSDFFGEYCAHHRDNPEVRVFLLGAGPGVADEAMRRINARLGRRIVVDALSPSFGFERNEAECEQIVERINASGATVLAVGVGAPKQEKWIMRWRARLPQVRVFMGIGATIEFEAGHVARAPRWMQHSGLEWAWRLLREPRRMWRRYLVEDPPFFGLLLLQKLGRDAPSRAALRGPTA